MNLPTNKLAEEQVVSACIIDAAVIDIVIDQVDVDKFGDMRTRAIFEAIVGLHGTGETIDFVTVHNELARMKRLDFVGESYLMDIVDRSASPANIHEYIDIVVDKANLRNIYHLAESLQQRSGRGIVQSDVLLEEMEAQALAMRRVTEAQKPQHIVQIAPDVLDRIEAASKTRDGVTGCHSGFSTLDYLTAGFHPSELIVIGGFPSMGKSALMINLAQHIAKTDGPILFFSVEMSKQELAMRWLSGMARVDSHAARRGRLDRKDMEKLARCSVDFANVPIFIDDRPGMTVNYVRSMSRIYVAAHGICAIFVDYLQILAIAGQFQGREAQISKISEMLKQLAKELGIPVIAAAQLNRSLKGQEKKRPILFDLRESGAIEQNADVVIFPYREDYFLDQENRPPIEDADLIVAKQRNGPVGVAHVKFEGKYTMFYDEIHVPGPAPSWNVNNEPTNADLF